MGTNGPERRLRRSLAGMLAGAAALVAAAVPLAAPAGAATSCARTAYTTTDHDGMWSSGSYVVANDMWNASGYAVSQRLTACSPQSWRVAVMADDRKHDGAVKTYPNVHRDFINWETNAQPSLASFRSIRTSWAATTPGRGVYDAAYDIWLDRLDREVMVWTDNRGQRPAGNRIATNVRLSGVAWSVWATRDNSYVAFVPATRLTHGTLDVKGMLSWLVSHHRLPASSKLAQIGFGFEVVSSGGSPASFAVSSFSVTTTR